MSRDAKSLSDSLRQARATISASAVEPSQQLLIGPLLKEIDGLLGSLEPSAVASAPISRPEESISAHDLNELQALRSEVERLRVLVEQERGLLEAVLEQSPHGVIISDPQGKLVLTSRAADRIWAGSAVAGDVQDWGKYRAYHPDGRPYEAEDWAMFKCLTRGETVEAEEVHFQRFDGTHGVMLGSAAPLTSHSGTLLGAVSVFADISRFKQIEQLKDRWVAVAGHEMRAPLSVMKLRIALARRNLERSHPQDLGQVLILLDEQVDRLNTMVNDMLDVSRVESGTLHVELETVALKPLAAALIEPLSHSTTGHRFVSHLEDLVVLCDRLRTEQVLSNLIGNAMRYSAAGLIEVFVREVDGEAVIQVKDQGRGLDPAIFNHLFEPFVRAEQESTRHSGLGLGLYLAREMVNRMGGRIWAASEGPGKGSTFSFTLPLAR